MKPSTTAPDEQPSHERFRCYDCGSTIDGHHTVNCDVADDDDVRDLENIPGTQYWVHSRKGTHA